MRDKLENGSIKCSMLGCFRVAHRVVGQLGFCDLPEHTEAAFTMAKKTQRINVEHDWFIDVGRGRTLPRRAMDGTHTIRTYGNYRG